VIVGRGRKGEDRAAKPHVEKLGVILGGISLGDELMRDPHCRSSLTQHLLQQAAVLQLFPTHKSERQSNGYP